MNVLIAGAGIGGLTAALGLHAVGIEATVLESVREPRPLGVGINLLPHAVEVLTELGLGAELAATGVATRELVYYDQTGAVLFTEPRGLAGGYRHPQYSIHRGELQMLLLETVRERLGERAVRTGTPLLGFEQNEAEVRAEVPGETLRAAALIGADGLHSMVRKRLHPGPDPLLWSGVRMWRGATETEPFRDGRSMAIVRGPGGVELVVYPIGPRTLNWVVQVPVAEPGPLPGDASWNTPGDPGEVLACLGDWNPGWLDVPGLVRGAERILEYPMVDREPLPHWGQGRVSLLGDAAHPMYPVGANGASQAIVDAHVLAAELRGNVPEGLAAYQRSRRAATTEVVAANRAMQRTGEARSAAELARITGDYRRRTGADRTPARSDR